MCVRLFFFRSISLPMLFVLFTTSSLPFSPFCSTFFWFVIFARIILDAVFFTSIRRFLQHFFQENIIIGNAGNGCDNKINKTRQINVLANAIRMWKWILYVSLHIFIETTNLIV